MESVELVNQAKALIVVYSNDLNNDLLIELKYFIVPLIKLQERGFFQIVRMKMKIPLYYSLSAQSIKPVSYTHLDVYKRQAHM